MNLSWESAAKVPLKKKIKKKNNNNKKLSPWSEPLTLALANLHPHPIHFFDHSYERVTDFTGASERMYKA